MAAVLRVTACARRRLRLIRLVVRGVVAPPAGCVGGTEPAWMIDLAGGGRRGRLHGWLLIHVPLAAALLVLLVAHAVLALRYTF